jgi:hypothetical protein
MDLYVNEDNLILEVLAELENGSVVRCKIVLT